MPRSVRIQYSAQSRAKKDAALFVFIVDVALDARDLETAPQEEADVDTACVVAVDEHRVRERCGSDGGEELLGEVHERGTALGFDDAEHIGGDIVHDARGAAHGDFVYRFVFQIDPANPIASSALQPLRSRRHEGVAGAMRRTKLCSPPAS